MPKPYVHKQNENYVLKTHAFSILLALGDQCSLRTKVFSEFGSSSTVATFFISGCGHMYAVHRFSSSRDKTRVFSFVIDAHETRDGFHSYVCICNDMQYRHAVMLW